MSLSCQFSVIRLTKIATRPTTDLSASLILVDLPGGRLEELLSQAHTDPVLAAAQIYLLQDAAGSVGNFSFIVVIVVILHKDDKNVSLGFVSSLLRQEVASTQNHAT